MTIAIEQLDFSYGRLPVLEGVTAVAEPGRITAVFGPNAAGKSTLLRCAIGLLRPDRGAARIRGDVAHRLSPRALARRVAYVPQRTSVALPFTVREVVGIGRYALPANGRAVAAALERLELEAVADRPFPALSVGQQQRVALARALAQHGEGGCIVLDEPTAAMDLRHARDTLGLLRELADAGATVLVAMHEIAAGAAAADDAWLLAPAGPGEGGAARLRAAGPVGEVLEPVRLESVFGVPFEWIETPDGRRLLLAETTGAGVPGCGGRAGGRAPG